MKIAAITASLETLAHPSLQENYDNAGLITGNLDWDCTGAIICLDTTEAVIQEAIAKGCNLVIAHHPIVFRGMKKITGKNYVERIIIAAIKSDIAIYAIHTNLDNIQQGVNGMIAQQLGLQNTRVLQPKASTLLKLFVFVPEKHAGQVRAAIFAAGAGQIGQYSECSFNTAGTGTFKAGEGTHPFAGRIGVLQEENEVRIETVFPAWMEQQVLNAMKRAHPYEEVAYDLLALANPHPAIGSGMVGNLPDKQDAPAFLEQLKSIFQVPVIRHTAFTGTPIRRVALCGGAGSFLISNAIAAGADIFITADMKYHDFFDADGRILIADPGHYESEQFTIRLLAQFLQEKFPTFAALKTEVKTNPVHYFL